MLHMRVVLDGEGIFKGEEPKNLIHLTNSITVTALAKGMDSGKASVAFIFDLPDGRKVFAETSLALFQAAAAAFTAKYGQFGGQEAYSMSYDVVCPGCGGTMVHSGETWKCQNCGERSGRS